MPTPDKYETNEVLSVDKTLADDKPAEEDPIITAFLDLIELDTINNHHRLRPMTAGRLERALELTDGVEIDLDAPLDPDDE